MWKIEKSEIINANLLALSFIIGLHSVLVLTFLSEIASMKKTIFSVKHLPVIPH